MVSALIIGFPSQRLATCHLLSRVALARPAVTSRAQSPRDLPVSVQCKAQRGLHQSVPLQTGGESRAASGTCTASLGIRTRPLDHVVHIWNVDGRWTGLVNFTQLRIGGDWSWWWKWRRRRNSRRRFQRQC